MKTIHEWLRVHPAPELKDLISQYDGYDKIPREAWDKFYHDCALWLERYRTREFDR